MEEVGIERERERERERFLTMVAAPPMASAPLLCPRLRLGTATANLASGVGGVCCAQVGRTQRRRMRVGVRWRRADAAGWCGGGAGGCARLGGSLPLRERVRGRRGCETTGWGQRERIRVGKKIPLAHYSSLSTARSFFTLLSLIHGPRQRLERALSCRLWLWASLSVSAPFPLCTVET